MGGGPSQLDLFEPKAALKKYEGQPVPDEVLMGADLPFIERDAALMASPFKFAQHGQSGAVLSELLPNLGKIVDDVAIVRISEPTADFYRLTLEQGIAVTAIVTGQNGSDVALDLVNASGSVVATARPSGTNAGRAIGEFRPSASGPYYLKVFGSQSDYSLVVFSGAVFDEERNDDLASSQELGGNVHAAGYIAAAGNSPAPASVNSSRVDPIA